jgi:transglutaminase-like putative cysteine protease
MISKFLDLTVRVGCHIEYESTMPTAALFMLRPRVDDSHLVNVEQFTVSPGLVRQEFQDAHGNTTRRAMLLPGLNTVDHDALISVSSVQEDQCYGQPAVPVADIPAEYLRYTLPSRYCDSDKLMEFAWDHFGQVAQGSERVQAICDWVHTNIEYRFGSGRPDLSASNIGLDAVDGAFGTIYGDAKLTYFEVWSYQVNPGQVMLGSARDMSKRLDGTTLVRYS